MRAPPTLAPLSIGTKVAGPGAKEKVGAVEALEYLAILSDLGADRHAFPCPWLALFQSCRKGSSGGCAHCSARDAPGAKPQPHPPGAVKRVRAACSPRVRGFVKA
eukprot:4875940-Pleurochrysis_carterae.AAC.1